MTRIDPETDSLVPQWLSVTEVAEELNVDASRVRQMIREHKLLGVEREGGKTEIPAAFIAARQVLKGLSGTLTLLSDAGYDPVEAVRWLFTADDTLPGTPVEALASNRGKEVKRRAQALGF